MPENETVTGATLRTLTLDIEGRPSTTWRLDDPQVLADLKKTPFVLAEGAHYRLSYSFTVSGDIVSGLKYVSAVFRKGLKVSKDQQMLGSFGPQDKEHTVRLPRHGWEEAPSGRLSRGNYTAKSTFVDDNGTTLGELEYAFDITENWPATESTS
ncbi:hypothetical protein ACFV6D_21750 [Kitasatospora sp. NPDC059812]|uniref:hypothetical protein n=1 Tax=unclassified Kitasatospora TaxID=2633591 RepID=UPI0036491441